MTPKGPLLLYRKPINLCISLTKGALGRRGDGVHGCDDDFSSLFFYCSFILCAYEKVRSDEQLPAHDLPSAWQRMCSSLKKPLRHNTSPPCSKLSWMIAGCWTYELNFCRSWWISSCRSVGHMKRVASFYTFVHWPNRNWLLGCYTF